MHCHRGRRAWRKATIEGAVNVHSHRQSDEHTSGSVLHKAAAFCSRIRASRRDSQMAYLEHLSAIEAF